MKPATATWNVSRYLTFDAPRLRPALDLLAQTTRMVAPGTPSVQRILDLGCGTGNAIPFLQQAYPAAAIHGVDSSSSMLAKAAADLCGGENAASNRITFQEADINTYKPDQPFDLVFSNATLHWLDQHEQLFPRLLSPAFLKPGGMLAVQVPFTLHQPSHLLMTEAYKAVPGCEQLIVKAEAKIPQIHHEPAWYYDILQPLCSTLNIWKTEYAQILTGDQPVAEFTRSTGLTPFMNAVGGEDSPLGQQLWSKYCALTTIAYPKCADGKTLFPFTRLFLVMQSKA